METKKSIDKVSESTFYIVGGLPQTGKTTVADKLAHDLRIGSMETDYIRVLFNTTPTSKIRVGAPVGVDKVTRKLRPRLECLIEVMVRRE